MTGVQLSDLDELIMRVITESDHPEITAVEVVPTPGRPDNHTRVRVDFADGASVYVMVGEVRRGGRATEAFTVPREVMA
ncbi:hypothetical protein B1813_08330 [Saccharomonospora piscinae]|uniref:Uncharacterized protein n=1 Tax=Saccharomonospora piscinae TaxID=687388 RepID=A0A1V9A580_SACPI|nr:hypothetical protein [Saccharomonospora piscinae]OQO92231.1 hypothetical protein B1813_08330 [Saccharomonospora piscinae]TLW92065.1 hypothetical protein FFT09_14345 [Saccharomonospora piscinae]